MPKSASSKVLKPVYDFTPAGWTVSLLNKAGAVIFVSRPHTKPSGAIKALKEGREWFDTYAAQNDPAPAVKAAPKKKAPPKAAPAPVDKPKLKSKGNAAPAVEPAPSPEG